MIAVDRELAALDARHAQFDLLPAFVLEHDGGAEMPVLRRHVGDIVGEREFGLVRAEAVGRRQCHFHAVADPPALQRLFDLLEQRPVHAVHVTDRQVVLFEHLPLLIEDRVREINNLVAAYGIVHCSRWPRQARPARSRDGTDVRADAPNQTVIIAYGRYPIIRP